MDRWMDGGTELPEAMLGNTPVRSLNTIIAFFSSDAYVCVCVCVDMCCCITHILLLINVFTLLHFGKLQH